MTFEERLAEIRNGLKYGHVRIRHISWMAEKVTKQQEVIEEQKRELARLREQLNTVTHAYEAYKSAH